MLGPRTCRRILRARAEHEHAECCQRTNNRQTELGHDRRLRRDRAFGYERESRLGLIGALGFTLHGEVVGALDATNAYVVASVKLLATGALGAPWPVSATAEKSR